MWKSVLAGTAVFAIVGTSLVYAQQQPARDGGQDHQRWQFSQEDRAAFAAARIAALRAGLALNADQEKTWPAFETALKDLAKYRTEQRNARRNAQPSDDPTERLRRAADALNGYGAALKKLADAQQPLYGSLDQAQKRRFAVLSHRLRPGHHGWGHRGAWGDHGGMRPGMEPGMREGMMQRRGPGMGGQQGRGQEGRSQDGRGNWRGEDRGGQNRGGPDGRGQDGREGRNFGGWRDQHRFGRNDQGRDVPRLEAPETAGEGDSL